MAWYDSILGTGSSGGASGSDKSSSSIWSGAIPILGSAVLGAISNWGSTSSANDLKTRELDMLEQYRNQQMQLEQDRMAMEKENQAAQLEALKKQMIQRAYSELVSAALQGGMAEANAMANIGTMGQRAVLGGAR